MKAMREIWVDFKDGSVAKYVVREEDFQCLINQLMCAEISRTIWVDGLVWTG